MAGVFISYRRDDSAGITGRIYDRLAASLGRAKVFRDLETIAPGVLFTKHGVGTLVTRAERKKAGS